MEDLSKYAQKKENRIKLDCLALPLEVKGDRFRFEVFLKSLLAVLFKLTSRHALKMKVCWKKNDVLGIKIRTRLDEIEEFDYE